MRLTDVKGEYVKNELISFLTIASKMMKMKGGFLTGKWLDGYDAARKAFRIHRADSCR